jgi:hypothetical protein
MASTLVVTPVEATVVAPPEEEEEPCHDESSVDLAQFFRAFFRSKGTREIVFITMFLALGKGCLVGVVGVSVWTVGGTDHVTLRPSHQSRAATLCSPSSSRFR